MKVKKLEWSEEYPPGPHGIRYNHVFTDIEGYTFFIEWKAWKERDDYICDMSPFGPFVVGYTLEETKEKVQDEWEKFIARHVEE